MSLCGDHDYSDDLVQETLVKALNNLHSFRPGTNMRSWLFTILRNTYFSDRRRMRREVPDEDGMIAASLSTAPAQEPNLELKEFQRALSLLNGHQRKALMLIGAAGFSYDEAAAICGCSSGTVKSRVNRARVKLCQILSPRPEDMALNVGWRAARQPVTSMDY
jgi:RNA polymerase sigma-70 factor (ECF subfamily)